MGGGSGAGGPSDGGLVHEGVRRVGDSKSLCFLYGGLLRRRGLTLVIGPLVATNADLVAKLNSRARGHLEGTHAGPIADSLGGAALAEHRNSHVIAVAASSMATSASGRCRCAQPRAALARMNDSGVQNSTSMPAHSAERSASAGSAASSRLWCSSRRHSGGCGVLVLWMS